MELTMAELGELMGRPRASAPLAESLGKRIVILQRGFVYVGDVTRIGDTVRIENAANVRRWGTTAGLGQLAKDGPQKETVLDRSEPVECHVLAVVGMIECVPSAWR